MDGCEFNGKNISVTFAQGDRKSNFTKFADFMIFRSFLLIFNDFYMKIRLDKCVSLLTNIGALM